MKAILHHRPRTQDDGSILHQYAIGAIFVCQKELVFPSTPKKRKNVGQGSFFLRGETTLMGMALTDIASVDPGRFIQGLSLDQVVTGMRDL